MSNVNMIFLYFRPAASYELSVTVSGVSEVSASASVHVSVVAVARNNALAAVALDVAATPWQLLDSPAVSDKMRCPDEDPSSGIAMIPHDPLEWHCDAS